MNYRYKLWNISQKFWRLKFSVRACEVFECYSCLFKYNNGDFDYSTSFRNFTLAYPGILQTILQAVQQSIHPILVN